MNIPDTKKKRVVVVGGGFGGLALVNGLDSRLFQTVLVDRNNYHQFQPLLYQVASAGLESDSISFPFRKMMRRRRDFYFRLASMTEVRAEQKTIVTTIGELRYDYLVLAAGTTTNFFGNEAIRRQALPMKSVVESLELRNALLLTLEEALNCTDPVRRQALMNVVVVGGGATGVEVAGALAEMKRFVIPCDYPDLDASKLNIYLLEGADRLLGGMSPEASANAERFLCGMGVKVMTGKLVTDYADETVALADGEKIPARTLIWVSGVTAERFPGVDAARIGRGGRIAVDRFNAIEGMEGVFVIGDMCLQPDEGYPNGHPQVAPVAMQQGRLLARNLHAALQSKALKPFHYHNQGALATVGRNKAVADIGRWRLHGFPAWAVWMLVHLRSILGVKNKLSILLDWVWNYFAYDHSMRFILFVPRRERPDGHSS